MRIPKRVKKTFRKDTKFCILPLKCDQCNALIIFDRMTLVGEEVTTSTDRPNRYRSIYRCKRCLRLFT